MTKATCLVMVRTKIGGEPRFLVRCENLGSTRCLWLRDELLHGELFCTLREAQVLIEQWRVYYNTIRPHSSHGYRPPAPETVLHIEALPNQWKAA